VNRCIRVFYVLPVLQRVRIGYRQVRGVYEALNAERKNTRHVLLMSPAVYDIL